MFFYDNTLRKTGGRTGVDAKAGGGHSEVADILLRLKQDDVDFWSKEAAQHHRPTEADGDAHGGRLHLQDEKGMKRFPVKHQKLWSVNIFVGIFWF